MKRLTLTAAIAALVGGLSLSGVAQADFDANMSRVAGASGSGHTVIDQCGDGVENWDGATATLVNRQSGGTGKVKVRLKGGKPNTHYTVWVRLKGKDQNGESFGGSPITGGGATPLAPSSDLGELVDHWDGPGSDTGSGNSFFTNHQGDGLVQIDTDFPLEGGAYPFNNMDAASLAQAEAKRGINLTAAPTAFADPRQAGITGTPFLVRMVSHCQDGKSHGLSPSNREAWFQYP